MDKSDGGPAFPTDFSWECDTCGSEARGTTPHVGMSMRDYFAAAALTGLASDAVKSREKVLNLPELCFTLADAMLEQRKK